jgi:hypothetical protein
VIPNRGETLRFASTTPIRGQWKRRAGLDPALRDIFPVKPRAEKRRLELLKEAYVKARYSLTWRISREDLDVLAQRIALLRERTQVVCQAYIESLGDPAAPA